MLKAHFQNDDINEYEGFSSQTNNQWTPKEVHHSVKTYIQAVKNDIATHKPDPNLNRKQNQTYGEEKTLASLKERDNIIISKQTKEEQ